MHDPDLERQLKEHHGPAFGWALSCCGWDRASAQDVLQTVYLKVLQGRAKFAGRSSFKTFLFGVIRRTAAEHRRASALKRLLPLSRLHGHPEGRSAVTDPGLAVERSDEAKRLVAALRELTSRQREVLHLVFYQDLSIAEAAQVIGVSLGTARTHYERGKQKLRELLGGERG
jgi:RNA polymerase sigma-70 factor (ECF subfamily)